MNLIIDNLKRMKVVYDRANDLYLDEKDNAAIQLIESVNWLESLDLLVLYGQILLNPSRGKSKKEKLKKGIESLEKALEMGSTDAAEELGDLYFYSDHLIKQDIPKAISCWEKGYGLGSVLCVNELLKYYKDYDELSYNKIIELATFLTKDDIFKTTGFFNLGKVYMNPEFEVFNVELALKYYNKACELGSEIACMKMMELYYNGNDFIAKDIAKSFEYCKKASKSSENGFFGEEIDFWLKRLEKELKM